MFRKIWVTTLMVGFFSVPAAAQSTHIAVSYQSFKPFVHFQLNLGSAPGYYRDSYQAAYLKGYMDGVNDAYYHDYRFYELVRDIDIYEAGYRDGYRDRGLLIRLRGNSWYHRHKFVYDDYHSPYYSVQIWLNGLTFAFLQAPAHRLPNRWKRHAHPTVRDYRARMQKRKHHARIKNRYKKYASRLRMNARKARSQYRDQQDRRGYRTGAIQRASRLDRDEARKQVSQPRQHRDRSRATQNSRGNRRSVHSAPRETSPARQYRNKNRSKQTRKAVSKRKSRVRSSNKPARRKAVRSGSDKKSNRRHTVRRERKNQRNRGSVTRSRSSKESKSRGSGRSRRGNRR